MNYLRKKNNLPNARLEWSIIYIWNWNIDNPQIWDLKISFNVVLPSEISAIWMQKLDTLVWFKTKTDTTIDLLQYGNVSIEEMYTKAHEDNNFLAWVLRWVGLLLMFVGFNMVFGIFVTLAKVIPFISNIIGFGTWILAFLLTLVLWGGTIIIAWLFVRPIISIAILLVIVAAIFGVMRIKKEKSSWEEIVNA